MFETISDHYDLLSQGQQLQRGINKLVTPSNPAAGAGYTYSCDPSYYEVIRSAYFTFTASAVVATRVVTVSFLGPDGETVAFQPVVGSVAASQAGTAYLDPWLPNPSGTWPGGISAWMPEVVMMPGWKFRVSIALEDVGDTLTGIALRVHSYATSYAGGTDAEDHEHRIRRELRELADRW
jgi:hypothetical protein